MPDERRKKRGGAWWLCWRVSLVVLAAWTLIAWAAAHALVVSATEMQHADALVVLGGSSAYQERTRAAAELFREGRAPRIVLTNDGEQGGWSSAEQRNPFFFERASDELRRAGVPAASVEVLPAPLSSTHEEALALRDYATARGLRSLLVVTSGYHSRRALWTFQHVFVETGIEVGVWPAPPGEQTPGFATWWVSPKGWKLVAGEYAKFAYYLLHYR